LSVSLCEAESEISRVADSVSGDRESSASPRLRGSRPRVFPTWRPEVFQLGLARLNLGLLDPSNCAPTCQGDFVDVAEYEVLVTNSTLSYKVEVLEREQNGSQSKPVSTKLKCRRFYRKDGWQTEAHIHPH
jgi:hypothetical protein